MTVAIYYHPEAYTTSGPKLMGRNAAGESFLRGFLTHSQAPVFWAQVKKLEYARHFAQTVRAYGRPEPVKAVDDNTLIALAQAGVVYYPGPGIGEHAFHRAAFGHGAWSLCGITHTICSHGAMDAIAQVLTAPVQPWDALICTSNAGKDAVLKILQAQADYLAQRLGAQRLVLPQLPVIPLGVHVADFTFTPEQRQQARQALGADEKTHVVLFVGRLSFHAKAHPLAMYQALEQVAQKLPKDEKLMLVEFGMHPNDAIAKAYLEAAKLACPQVIHRHLNGREEENRTIAWAGADVFCSLSDNIQETFGITPIEAMAAGLPVVVSDWDGYKDTVRDGVDGYRIPTLMPQVGLGADLALRHTLAIDTYDMYIGHASTLTAVDVNAAAEALSRLCTSRELRLQMGAAARQRAQQVYDWAAIIPQYEALWAQLSEMRKAQAPALQQLPHPWSARMDPFHAFAAYPTHTLTPQTPLALVDTDAATALQRVRAYRDLAMVDYAKVVLPTDAEVQAVLTTAAAGPRPAAELVADLPQQRQAFVFRALAWLVKLGVLRMAAR